MNDFIKKWNSDQRFKTKIKLLLYFLFFIIVAIYAISSNKNITQTEKDEIFENEEKNNNKESTATNNIINLTNNYKYNATININNEQTKYTISKEQDEINIIKYKNNIETSYIKENNNYYLKELETKTLTTKDNVYDIICPDCFNLKTINEYLNKGIKENNNYKIYLKDIILAYDGEDYITITVDNNQIYADYTCLLQVFNNQNIKYTVNIKIEE